MASQSEIDRQKLQKQRKLIPKRSDPDYDEEEDIRRVERKRSKQSIKFYDAICFPDNPRQKANLVVVIKHGQDIYYEIFDPLTPVSNIKETLVRLYSVEPGMELYVKHEYDLVGTFKSFMDANPDYSSSLFVSGSIQWIELSEPSKYVNDIKSLETLLDGHAYYDKDFDFNNIEVYTKRETPKYQKLTDSKTLFDEGLFKFVTPDPITGEYPNVTFFQMVMTYGDKSPEENELNFVVSQANTEENKQMIEQWKQEKIAIDKAKEEKRKKKNEFQ